jgi:hypothetical protein
MDLSNGMGDFNRGTSSRAPLFYLRRDNQTPTPSVVIPTNTIAISNSKL